jgi:hypothetical protein
MKETLEEYIKEVTKNFGDEMSVKFVSGGIKLGAKWQQERMYSEIDMELAFETGRNFQLTGENNFKELIQQFKKK